MKKLKQPTWQEKFSGKHILNLPDTCRVIVRPQGNKFAWDFNYPPGKLIHGVCSTLSEAKEIWIEHHKNWILEMWATGNYDKRAKWVIQF